MTMPTPELAFDLGAKAMQSRIAAMLMIKGFQQMAIDVLGMETPPLQLPEVMFVDGIATYNLPTHKETP